MGKNTTYSLLVRSEETGRSLVETMVYGLLALSVMVSILQLAVSPLPEALNTEEAQVAPVSHVHVAAVSPRP